MSALRPAVLALLCCCPAGVMARDLSGTREFPQDLILSFREQARPEGVLTLLAAGTGASLARYGNMTTLDDFHVSATLKRRAPLGPVVTEAGAIIGYPGYLMAAMGTTYLAGWRYDADAAQEFGLLGFEALTLAGIQTLVLKLTIPRLRPDRTDLTAFPSGHTSASFALATVAASQWGWSVGAPAVALAGLVGYTRLEGGKHYLSDVLFGAGLGIVSGRAVYAVRRRAHPERYAFAPFVSPGGFGIAVQF